MYSSVSLVRELSGLSNSTKISDVRVKSKILVADSMIDGALGYRYQLPIAKHYQNTLTFSGTGTGTDTLDIIINGITYSITISSGLTASQCADIFRALTFTGFITDTIGSGSSVLLISETSDDAEVNVSSAEDGSGITTTIGTVQERYPQTLTYLSADIATALLLQEEYGLEAEGTSRDGFARMKQIQLTLQYLQGSKTPILRIFDEVTKSELNTIASNTTRFLPNDSTEIDYSNPTNSKVSINTTF